MRLHELLRVTNSSTHGPNPRGVTAGVTKKLTKSYERSCLVGKRGVEMRRNGTANGTATYGHDRGYQLGHLLVIDDSIRC